MSKLIFPAEWYPQSAVQLTWPHRETDWAPVFDEVVPCFVAIAKEIIKRETLLIVCQDEKEVRHQLGNIDKNRIIFREMHVNDTWARDYGGITVFEDAKRKILDFVFNGWGMKFAANHDNLITRGLFQSGTFDEEAEIVNMQPFVLEGGSIESDGQGTMLSTIECLSSVNRNEYLNKEQLEYHLKDFLGVERFLWLENGYLAGDDTDSHIDTLARFCSPDTIAYLQCLDRNDEHFEELNLMEEELKTFRQKNGEPYNLLPLPMADAIYDEDNERLPATYANFLIINGAVLVPTYNSPKDEIALAQIKCAFPNREIIGIDCRALIRQHGSLHCITMQFPK